MCDDNSLERDCNCISELLSKIICLQNMDYDNEKYEGCEKPFLGPTREVSCYNTRPLGLYNCATGALWSIDYEGGTSTIFRVESIDECCLTCRILTTTDTANVYTDTKEFFTINLNCVAAVKCYPDTYVDFCF